MRVWIKPEQDGLSRPDGRRYRRSDYLAERSRSRRPARRRTDRRKTGFHLYGPDAFALQYGRTIRQRNRTCQSGRLAGAASRRGDHRIRNAELFGQLDLPRARCGPDDYQPIPGKQRGTGGQGGKSAAQRNVAIVSGRNHLRHAGRLDQNHHLGDSRYRHDPADRTAAGHCGHLPLPAGFPGDFRSIDRDSCGIDRRFHAFPAVRIFGQCILPAGSCVGHRDWSSTMPSSSWKRYRSTWNKA